MFYSWRADLFIHRLRNNVNTVIESQLISHANGTEQQTQECWIQQLAVLRMVYYLSEEGGGGGSEVMCDEMGELEILSTGKRRVLM